MMNLMGLYDYHQNFSNLPISLRIHKDILYQIRPLTPVIVTLLLYFIQHYFSLLCNPYGPLYFLPERVLLNVHTRRSYKLVHLEQRLQFILLTGVSQQFPVIYCREFITKLFVVLVDLCFLRLLFLQLRFAL